MELMSDIPKSEAEQLLGNLPEVKEVKHAKGGSLIVTHPLIETLSAREKIERRLNSKTVWLA
ncbi:MAG: hypothetical protein PHF50_02030 [Patescibacteria group bacterium]|nr:hypothetical protein [Patescibacteria group bacterium]